MSNLQQEVAAASCIAQFIHNYSTPNPTLVNHAYQCRCPCHHGRSNPFTPRLPYSPTLQPGPRRLAPREMLSVLEKRQIELHTLFQFFALNTTPDNSMDIVTNVGL